MDNLKKKVMIEEMRDLLKNSSKIEAFRTFRRRHNYSLPECKKVLDWATK